jgi:hypothetical protein
MTGIAKGLLPEYVRRSMITERDRDRLYEVSTFWRRRTLCRNSWVGWWK